MLCVFKWDKCRKKKRKENYNLFKKDVVAVVVVVVVDHRVDSVEELRIEDKLYNFD
jgi:hypothetical protein